jgi:hypothetical protein
LDEGWIRALQVKTVATHRHYSSPPRTILMLQLADQAELLGLLNRLHNLGLTLLLVELTPRGWPDKENPDVNKRRTI